MADDVYSLLSVLFWNNFRAHKLVDNLSRNKRLLFIVEATATILVPASMIIIGKRPKIGALVQATEGLGHVIPADREHVSAGVGDRCADLA